MFVAAPPEPAPTPFIECAYCDPDGMGTTDRWREWQRKAGAGEIEGFLRLGAVDPGGDE